MSKIAPPFHVVRVFQVANDTKLLAVSRKLGVTPAEIEAIFDETKADVSDKAWESLEKDIHDIVR